MILITGGAGFIGSNFATAWLALDGEPVAVLDKLGYAGNLANLAGLSERSDCSFHPLDIVARDEVLALMHRLRPRAIVHFAAESHVDRSILGPDDFIRSNIDGSFALLEASRAYWERLDDARRDEFRWVHISTDEVYGALAPGEPPVTETRAYAPNSPYAASKAASDHLVRAWHRTYGLPTVTLNCSNNYGPRQFPEKLIPLLILRALEGKSLPLYGDGEQVRDWLFVADHCAAIRAVLARGRVGEVYHVGGGCELTNREVAETVCAVLDELHPKAAGRYADQIEFVADRPGHDRRYAVDSSKIERELGWVRAETFASGLRKTVQWYLDHPGWVADVRSGAYREWIALNYGQGRGGVKPR
ncbi:MAG: dTDP-glucose 4,6-dehydratase [Burkholderiaceae bacterium]